MHTIEEIYTAFVSCGYRLSTDSRNITPGCMYLALTGEKFNGNLFAAKALEAGASCAVVSELTEENRGDTRFLLVEEGLKTLQNLAAWHRCQFEIPVLAICGSNGKTTTKELIVAVLSRKYEVHATRGNFNNHIGVPLTLLQLRPEHQIAVIEMGANHLQEIADLCEIAKPTYGLITSIGMDHLEGYGSVDNVAQSNEELFVYLRKNGGFAWISTDDTYVQAMEHPQLKSVNYGRNADYFAKYETMSLTGMHIKLGKKENSDMLSVQTHLSGRHNLQNLLAAYVVGDTFGVNPDEICQALAGYTPVNNRSQYIQISGKEILLDAYNANPSSVEAALQLMFSIPGKKTALILGDMFELGEYAESEHKRILEKALLQNGVKVIAAGEIYFTVSGYMAHKNLKVFRNTEDLLAQADQVREFLTDSDQILIKGSRGMAMERVLSIWE